MANSESEYDRPSTSRITKLGADNYTEWVTEMEGLLAEKKLWYTIDETKEYPTEEDERSKFHKWRLPQYQYSWTTDAKATIRIIMANCDSFRSDEIRTLRDSNPELTPSEVWEYLREKYDKVDSLAFVQTWSKLVNHKLSDTQPTYEAVRKHLDTFVELTNKIKRINQSLDSAFASLMLISMPGPKIFDTTIDMLAEDPSFSLETAYKRLLAKGRRYEDEQKTESKALKATSRHNPKKSKKKPNQSQKDASNSNDVPKCTHCKKSGHKEDSCWFKHPEKRPSNTESTENTKKRHRVNVTRVIKAIASMTLPKDIWADDSGASEHVTNNRSLIRRYKSYKNPAEIVIGDGRSLPGLGYGSVRLGNLTLKKVIYAPGMEVSVISIHALAMSGHTIVHKGDEGLVYGKSDEVLLRTRYSEEEGLYLVSSNITRRMHGLATRTTETPAETSIETSTEASKSTKSSTEEYFKWHQRLGHVSSGRMRVLANAQLVEGLKPGMFNFRGSPPVCETCILGKQTMMPSKKKTPNHPAIQPLELLHVDICGDWPVESLPRTGMPATDPIPTRSKYFLTVVDDYSRYVWTLFLRTKGESATKLAELINFIENQSYYNHKVKRIRFDQAPEFFGGEMLKMIRERGIGIETSGAYAHQQNGKAERMNRTVSTAGRTQLIQSGLPEAFWAEAIRTATYVENRCITRALRTDKPGIPQHLVNPSVLHANNDIPVHHLRPFGCKAFVTLPPELRTKALSEPRAYPAIFLGHTDTTNVYRVWSIKSKTIKLVRDVKFLENEFPAKDPTFYQEQFGDMKKVVVIESSQTQQEPESGPLGAQGLDPRQPIQVPTEPVQPVPESRRREPVQSEPEPAQPETESIRRSEPVQPVPQPIQRPEPVQPMSESIRRPEPVKSPVSESRRPELVQPETESSLRRSKRTPKPKKWACFARAMRLKSLHKPRDIPLSYKEAITGPYASEWGKAIEAELEALRENKTWENVSRVAETSIKNALTTRWVFTKKIQPNGVRFKARLVVRGFEQQYGIDYKETFAPTTTYQGIRTLLAISARMGLKIHQMDVKTAFINSPLEEIVHIYAPEGLNTTLDSNNSGSGPTKILRLRKSLYGLKQAARSWNSTIHQKLETLGFKCCLSDYCIYVSKTAMLALYVDDMLIISHDLTEIERIKAYLSQNFKMEDLGEAKRFLGMDIERIAGGDIRISQKAYIESILDKYDMLNCKPARTPLAPGTKLRATPDDDNEELTSDEDRTLYQAMVGSIMYTMTTTRPDLAYAASALSRFNSNPGKQHFEAVKHVLRYLKHTANYGITYSAASDGSFNFHGYCDSDWAGDEDDRRSTSGFVFLLAGGAISWKSKKQSTVATSSTEAEYIACAMACKEAIWLRQLLGELQLYFDDETYEAHESTSESTSESTFVSPSTPSSKIPTTQILCDNNGAIALTKNPEHMQRTKHIDIAYHFVRERVECGDLEISYIPTDEMIADDLTKPLSSEKHEKHTTNFGIH